MATMKERYETEVVPRLQEELGVKGRLRVPRVVKIVVNMGMGVVDKDTLKTHIEEMMQITGQRPVVTRARKSISNFKLREGMSIGAKVTLRGRRMYEFLDRLISAALPRIRDFRGVPVTAFDGHGNFTLGVREQTIFPEIDPNHAGDTQGMDITIVTSGRKDEEGLLLLKMLGMPFGGK
jgi:large subunit ribosomal protein L5